MSFYPGNYGGGSPNLWVTPYYQTVATVATTNVSFVPQMSDWEQAAVKAEPDDEFTWLRRRVNEIEELAFA